jgi:hypothetical protein
MGGIEDGDFCRAADVVVGCADCPFVCETASPLVRTNLGRSYPEIYLCGQGSPPVTTVLMFGNRLRLHLDRIEGVDINTSI